MRLSSMADYAVVTMCAAARHCGGGRVSAAELACETGLPQPTVQKLVSLLSRASCRPTVRTCTGVCGGWASTDREILSRRTPTPFLAPGDFAVDFFAKGGS